MADTFLDEYLKYTGDLESPTIFHKWTAVTVFAHALGRRVFYNQGGLPIYPGQMMTLLVGPTGVKKSSAAKRGYDLIRQAKPLAKEPSRLHPMPQRMSNESFFDCLVPRDRQDDDCDPERVDCMGFLFASEFSSIANSNSYMEEIPEILTDMYDSCPGVYDAATRTMRPEMWQRRFRRDGTGGGFRLRNPGVTLLACTTPTAIRETLPPHIRSTGFLARVLVAYAARSDRPSNPLTANDDWRYPVRDRLAKMLALATELMGEAVLTPQAQRWHDEWFAEERLRVAKLAEGALGTGFAVRSQAHVMRLALVFASNTVLGQRPGVIAIERDYVEAAARWVQRIEAGLTSACGELAKDKHVRLAERVREAVRRSSRGKQPASYRDVQHYVMNSRRDHFKTPEITDALERLVELGEITQEGPMTKGRFRLCTRRPGPWTGTPAQGTPAPSYFREQWLNDPPPEPPEPEALDEERDAALLQEEIEAGMRDKDGKTLH